ncbi:MAG TPA: flavodoxin domain-containing protein [Candidatus Dormibacteraeota bacterium]|nr:flavodoxin domain-containing protein [Candidatus Dormibacteraeota bacterium]
MSILVTYASKYGATQGIAERIAATLEAEGLTIELLPINAVKDIATYEAFVIGSAAYMGSWLKEAGEFVRSNRRTLAAMPVWLFSSGPLGTETKDQHGRDVLVASEPKEFAEFAATIEPKDNRVFFGALDSKKLRGVHRLFSLVPASDRVLIEGDFRDWKLIEAWARSIAHELALAPAIA